MAVATGKFSQRVTWKLKSCPKCGGDIFVDLDEQGWFEKCLQCSLTRYLKEVSNASK